MAKLSAEALLKRHDAAMADLALWRTEYRDSYRYTQPARDTVDSPTKGEPRNSHIFDSQAVKSTSRATNKLQDLIFPSGKNIIELKPGPEFDKDEKAKEEVAKLLEEANKAFHAALWSSNFEIEINDALNDKLIGTLAMLFNEGPDDNPFHFSAHPQFAVAFSEAAWGGVGDVSREVSLDPRIAKQQWSDAEIPPEHLKAAEESRDGAKRTYVEIVYPDEDSFSAGPGGQIGRATRWFLGVIDKVEKKQLLKEQRVFDISGPWIVSRYSKASNEVRGRGPVLDALPDIRTTNKVVELVLKQASIATAGVWTGVDDGIFNPNMARFLPGSVIPVGSNGSANPTLAPLQFPGSLDFSQFVLADMRSNIREALFDEDLPDISEGVRSATEIVERLRKLVMDIGPAAGRIQKELIEPLVMRGLQILMRKGKISLPKDFRLDGQFINVQIVSPLARRQNLDNIEKLLQALEMSIRSVGEELTQLNFKVEDIPKYIAEQLGVPTDLMRDEAERENLIESVARNIAAAQQQQQAATAPPQPQAA